MDSLNEENSSENKDADTKALRDKMKARGTKLQAKFVEFNKKIEIKKSEYVSENASTIVTEERKKISTISHAQSPKENCAKGKGMDVNIGKPKERGSLSSNSLATESKCNDDVNFSENCKEMREKIHRIQGKLSRYQKNSKYNRNQELPSTSKVPSENNIDCSRTRSISERSSASNYSSSYSSKPRSISITIPSECEKSNDSLINSNDKELKTKKTRQRVRGKRGSKTKTTQANAEHIPIYARECENLNINAEALLILDLLYMPVEDHFDYLINLAKVRKIFVPSPDNQGFVYNPSVDWTKNGILLLGKQCRNLNVADLKRLETLINSSPQRRRLPSGGQDNQNRSVEQKKNTERRTKIFEDYVNDIVSSELPEDMQRNFQFPAMPKRQRTKNYFCRPDFEENLERFSQMCVEANLGVIVEGDIRINAKNNDQAFIKNVQGKRDAFLCSQLARKFALHGDIVRVFVRSDSSDNKNVEKLENQIKTITTELCTMQIQDKNDDLNSSIEEITEKVVIKTAVFQSSDNNESSNVNGSNVASSSQNEKIEVDTEDSPPVVEDEIDLNSTIDLILEQDNILIPEKSIKAFVIKIVKQVHNRKCVGIFSSSYRKDAEHMVFIPRDLKMPNIRIYRSDWPEAFKNGQIESIGDLLYVAQITDWSNDGCVGKILHPVGKCGELESENKAILLQNDLEMDPYDEKFNEMFRTPMLITEDDIKNREDIRSECVFTIDPLTARDLDDAMSCKKLPDGNYEIGVHISDVSYFLEEESELDEIVKLRTTSVYMVNEVFHMLPKPLCLKCSLLPGEDKFTYSVFWVINSNGDILNTRFSRTIVNSCTQFAYEHAQKIIDFPDQKFSENDFPQIYNGWTTNDIVNRIKILHSIADIFRKKRFDNGALKINKPKLYFQLNQESGEPIQYEQAILLEANFLIEEFMLLANQSVAEFINKKFPKISILRSHQPPLPNVLQKVQEKLKQFGLNLNISSSKSIYNSYNDMIRTSKNPEALEICLSQLVSKPMARARYFCNENVTSPEEFWHYALSIPFYTHFTSPIRRYPDVLVHRVLSAALGHTSPPKRPTDELHKIAALCNEKKYTAKLAGEDSSNLYFMYYIKSKKSLLMRAAIIELYSHSIEIILIESGHLIRIQFNKDVKYSFNPQAIPKVSILSFAYKSGDSIELKPFTEIEVEVYVEKFKIKARIPGTGGSGRKQKTANNNKESSSTNPLNEQIAANSTQIEEKNYIQNTQNVKDKGINEPKTVRCNEDDEKSNNPDIEIDASVKEEDTDDTFEDSKDKFEQTDEENIV